MKSENINSFEDLFNFYTLKILGQYKKTLNNIVPQDSESILN